MGTTSLSVFVCFLLTLLHQQHCVTDYRYFDPSAHFYHLVFSEFYLVGLMFDMFTIMS